MPPQIFKNKIIAVAGHLPEDLTIENVKRWTELRRGIFFNEMSHEVTHLLCTRSQFYGGHSARVKQALCFGKKCSIVDPAWFRESIFNEKRLPETRYDLRRDKKKRDRIRREKERIERGKIEAVHYINQNLFTPYRDEENFQYQIELTRENPKFGAVGQRHLITLWESHAKPSLYWFTDKYYDKKGANPKYHRPSGYQSPFVQEMRYFQDFFRKKTGIAWADRVALTRTANAECFIYDPPTGGKPVGVGLSGSYDWCLEVNAQVRKEQEQNNIAVAAAAADAAEIRGTEDTGDQTDKEQGNEQVFENSYHVVEPDDVHPGQ